jgi:hypothetical protein
MSVYELPLADGYALFRNKYILTLFIRVDNSRQYLISASCRPSFLSGLGRKAISVRGGHCIPMVTPGQIWEPAPIFIRSSYAPVAAKGFVSYSYILSILL